MQIFAKRTRTVVDPETAEKLRKEQEAQKERDADKAVEELLKLDPNTLNSKQRRLVKRYKGRNKSNESLSGTEQKDESSKQINDDEAENKSETSEPKPAAAAEEEESSSDSSDSDSDDEVMEPSGDNEEETKPEASGHKITGAPGEKTGASDDNPEGAAAKDNDGLDEDSVKKMLEKLNSKQRRKLMRRLEREGSSVLSEVHEEAVKLLKENDAEKAVSKETSEPEPDTKQTTSEKKRKKDWSDLSPEERLRREEQRQKQQEAAAKRAKEGPDATKRHPLNSERRRANRRKPKWERKRPVENEHDLSGYHMRRLKQAGEI